MSILLQSAIKTEKDVITKKQTIKLAQIFKKYKKKPDSRPTIVFESQAKSKKKSKSEADILRLINDEMDRQAEEAAKIPISKSAQILTYCGDDETETRQEWEETNDVLDMIYSRSEEMINSRSGSSLSPRESSLSS